MTDTAERYDAIVIGAGQGGGPLARALGEAGRRTAIVEREHVGGTCVNVGCTPTKTLVASARTAAVARRAAGYGVVIDPAQVSVDMRRVRQRKREIVASFRAGSQGNLETAPNVTLLFGEASFVAPKRLAVRGDDGTRRELTAETIVIDVGARPAIPKLGGIAEVPVLDSTSIMELDELPEHLLVLGGGYIGLEFGQMFRRFGSRVTIVQRGPRLLAREDADVAEAVAGILREDGIEVLLATEARRVARDEAGGVRLSVASDGTERELAGSHLLAAVSRTPNTDRLNLGAAGVELDDRGFVRVNERLETNVAGIYALGDVNGGPAFTHISYDDFRILKTNLLAGGNATTTDRLVPYTVFIDPQLGRVGLSEEQARRDGRAFTLAKLPMNQVARALETDEPRGFMKAIVDADTDLILGAAILGLEGGELMAMLQIAMIGKVPATTLRDGVFAHPTLAESFNNLFASLDAE